MQLGLVPDKRVGRQLQVNLWVYTKPWNGIKERSTRGIFKGDIVATRLACLHACCLATEKLSVAQAEINLNSPYLKSNAFKPPWHNLSYRHRSRCSFSNNVCCFKCLLACLHACLGWGTNYEFLFDENSCWNIDSDCGKQDSIKLNINIICCASKSTINIGRGNAKSDREATSYRMGIEKKHIWLFTFTF